MRNYITMNRVDIITAAAAAVLLLSSAAWAPIQEQRMALRDFLPALKTLLDSEEPPVWRADAEVLHASLERLLDSLVSVVDGLCTRAPTVLVLQDLHWADPSTVAVFTSLVVLLINLLTEVAYAVIDPRIRYGH